MDVKVLRLRQTIFVPVKIFKESSSLLRNRPEFFKEIECYLSSQWSPVDRLKRGLGDRPQDDASELCYFNEVAQSFLYGSAVGYDNDKKDFVIFERDCRGLMLELLLASGSLELNVKHAHLYVSGFGLGLLAVSFSSVQDEVLDIDLVEDCLNQLKTPFPNYYFDGYAANCPMSIVLSKDGQEIVEEVFDKDRFSSFAVRGKKNYLNRLWSHFLSPLIQVENPNFLVPSEYGFNLLGSSLSYIAHIATDREPNKLSNVALAKLGGLTDEGDFEIKKISIERASKHFYNAFLAAGYRKMNCQAVVTPTNFSLIGEARNLFLCARVQACYQPIEGSTSSYTSLLFSSKTQ